MTNKTQIIKLKDIVVDKKLYPRNEPYWGNIYRYTQAMKTGVKFPPIILAERDSKLVLVDGLHRLEAMRKLGNTTVETIILKGLTEKEIFVEAVKANVKHGQPLGASELNKIILKFEKYGLSPIQISEVIAMPVEKIEPFVAARTIKNALTGEVITLKKPLKYLSKDSNISANTMATLIAEVPLGNSDQITMFENIIYLFENKLVNKTKKINGLIQILKKLLDKY